MRLGPPRTPPGRARTSQQSRVSTPRRNSSGSGPARAPASSQQGKPTQSARTAARIRPARGGRESPNQAPSVEQAPRDAAAAGSRSSPRYAVAQSVSHDRAAKLLILRCICLPQIALPDLKNAKQIHRGWRPGLTRQVTEYAPQHLIIAAERACLTITAVISALPVSGSLLSQYPGSRSDIERSPRARPISNNSTEINHGLGHESPYYL